MTLFKNLSFTKDEWMDELYFERLALNDKAKLLWERGYYLESINDFEYRINLYSLGRKFIEVHCNKSTNDIESIVVVNDKSMRKYLSKVFFSNYYP